MERYLISVIVPIYNVEPYLKKCIESIINQTYKNLQILLVDDGSTDQSGAICDEYARKDKRIEVVHKENGGLVSARNAGLCRARGEYIGFVDADDYIDSGFYQELLRDIMESNVDFVHAGYIIEDCFSKKICNQYNQGIYEIAGKQADFIRTYIFQVDSDLHMQYGVVSKLFKAELIKKCYAMVPVSQVRGEDMLCTCLCLLHSDRIFLDTRAHYHYLMRSESLTHRNEIEDMIILANLYQCFIRYFGEYGMLSVVRDEMRRYFKDLFLGFLSLTLEGETLPLFKYGNVSGIRGKRIALYGAGMVGRDYYAQLSRYEDIEIVVWADKNEKACDYKKVTGKEHLLEYSFELLILAVLNRDLAETITSELVEMGIPENIIVWEKPRRLAD